MGGLGLRKFPGLVQPYSPSRDIDWADKSLESDRLMRFKEPLVRQEFVVYRHRDLIQSFIAFTYAFGAFFLVPLEIVNIGDQRLGIMCYVAGAGNLILGVVLDFIAFLLLESDQPPLENSSGNTGDGGGDCGANGNEHKNLEQKRRRERRETIANFRWYVGIFITCACSAETSFVGTIADFDHNCRESPDWPAAMGLRTAPASYYSDEEISFYCSRIISPFIVFTQSLSLPQSGVATVFLIPSYIIFDLGGQLAAELFVPHAPGRTEDYVVRFLIMFVVCVLAVLLHSLRYQASMAQFRQEILLRIANDLALKREEEVDTLLCNMLPLSVLDRLSRNQPVSDFTEAATVLFSDMRGFTAWSSTRTAPQVVAMLTIITLEIDRVASSKQVEKIKTIGDAYWAVAGLPDECLDHAERMCNFGNAILDVFDAQNTLHPEWEDVQIRVGIHSGPLNGGILGATQLSYEVFGETSTIAGEVEQMGTPGHVVVTEATLNFLEVPEGGGRGPVVGTISHGTGSAYRRPRDRASNRTEQPEGEGDGQQKQQQQQRTEEPTDWYEPQQPEPTDLLLYTIPRAASVLQALRTSRAAEPPIVNLSQTSAASDGSVESVSLILPSPQPLILHRDTSPLPLILPSPALVMERSNTSLISRSSSLSNILQRRMQHGAAAWTGDEGKKQRQEFLALRSKNSASESVSTAGMPTLEMITARYSKTKYKYLFPEFEDPAVEESFTHNLAHKQRRIFVLTRVAMMANLLVRVICLGFISRATFSILSQVLYSVSGVLALLDLALCFVPNFFAPRVQATLQITAAVLTLLGSGFMPPGSSPATNDVTYNFTVLVGAVMGFGNLGFVSAATLLAIMFFGFVPLTGWLIWPTVMLTSHFVFLLCGIMIVTPTFIATERLYRLQFLQQHTALYFQSKQKQRNEEQEALLGSMVPAHIVNDLMLWMQTGMDPGKTIVQTLPVTATCFLQIDLTAEEVSDVETSHLTLGTGGSASPEQQTVAFSSLPSSSSDPSVVRADQTPLSILAHNDLDPLSRSHQSPELSHNMSSSHLSLSSHAALLTNHWLQTVHLRVDGVLKRFKSIVKIKTVGDVVMLAGPFVPEYDLTNAADELLAAVWAIRKIAPVRAGLHNGELVGAVLGNSRLCFDIFGDTVNTASRCMTSGETGDISVSDEFYDSLPLVSRDGRGTGAAGRIGVNPFETPSSSSSSERSNIIIAEGTTTRNNENNTIGNGPEEGVGGSEEVMDDVELQKKDASHSHKAKSKGSPKQKWLSSEAVFSDQPISVEAKGKGIIRVRRLIGLDATIAEGIH